MKNVTSHGLGGVRKKNHVELFGGGSSLDPPQTVQRDIFSLTPSKPSFTHRRNCKNSKNSTFDEFAQKKFIEDQKIIMELSGRLQELQNEVNCMNDSRDFRDAESICSGNSHVTSPPGLFPRHPPFEGLLKPAFISQRQK